MIRIGKMTDYAIVLLTHIAADEREDQEKGTFNARDLSEMSEIPLPTVSKLLKTLCRGEILESIRGIRGGYRMARAPREVSIAQVITAVEGPIALTECSNFAPSVCDLESSCPVKENWQIISQTVSGALQQLTLEQMRKPMPRMKPAVVSGGHQ